MCRVSRALGFFEILTSRKKASLYRYEYRVADCEAGDVCATLVISKDAGNKQPLTQEKDEYRGNISKEMNDATYFFRRNRDLATRLSRMWALVSHLLIITHICMYILEA